MEILKDKFIEKLPEISRALKEADVIAIDAEFTGLTPPDINMRTDDDLQNRYSKIRKSVSQFAIVQYGVCAFKKTNDGYIAKPFNFYIFGDEDPSRPFGRPYFLASTSSLAFLRSNHFDFNKLIDGGIPFNSMGDSNPVEKMRPAEKTAYDTFISKIDAWLQNGPAGPLVLPIEERFQKRILHTALRLAKYNGFLRLHTRDSTCVEIQKLSEDERQRRTRNSLPSELNFRTIIELIKDAGCPVVAHNAMFDICHTINQFWRTLPQEVEDFKAQVADMWTKIIDTKYLAEFHPQLKTCFNSSVLGTLYETVAKELKDGGPTITMEKGYNRYSKKQGSACHEAGYDAFMTGVIYLGFVHYIREREELDSASENAPAQGNNSVHLPEYTNRIFLMRCDIPYIDLESAKDIAPQPKNRLFLDNIPPGLTNSGIELLFPELRPFSVSWVDAGAAWLIARHKYNLEIVELGRFGKERLRDFLPGGSRYTEAEKHGIPPEAEQIELMSFEKWQQTRQKDQSTTQRNAAPVSNESFAVPTGGSSYDDLDIDIAPSFAKAGLKRRRDKEDENLPQKKASSSTSL